MIRLSVPYLIINVLAIHSWVERITHVAAEWEGMSASEPSDVRLLIEQGLETYDISVDGEIKSSEIDTGEYEAEVPFKGELLIDDTFSNQGPLLYNKSEGELQLKGVRDGRLLLLVRL